MDDKISEVKKTESNHMRKFLCMALFLVLRIPVYSQDQQGVETLRYFDWGKNRYITVRVMHLGWMESYQTISTPGTRNARSLQYTTMKFIEEIDPNAQWSNWELSDTLPVPGKDSSILSEVYDEVLTQWRKEPNTGVEIVGIMPGMNAVKITVVPNGKSTPFWFDKDGDLHTFYVLYLISP
jgi:hypothetical protein